MPPPERGADESDRRGGVDVVRRHDGSALEKTYA
jgi:hypothetical protein